VSVIDTQGPSLKGTVNVGTSPQGIAVDEVAQRAYVATRDGVAVLDGVTLEETLSLPVADYQGIAVGSRIYVADATNSQLLSVNANTGSLVSSVAVGQGARGVALHSGSNTVYVAGSADNSVTLVRDNKLETAITRVGGPRGVAVDDVNDLVFVANGVSDNVSVVDGATHALVGVPIAVGRSPWGVAVNPAAGRLYVTNSEDATVSVIDVPSKAGIAIVTVGTTPRGVAVNPVTNRIYVANYGANTVSVIEGATNAVIATVPVGTSPTGVVVDTIANRVNVSHESDAVHVIDGATNDVIGSIGPLGGAPSAIAWSGVTQRLFLPNNDTPGAVWLLDAAGSSVIGSTAVSGVPASVCVDALRDLVVVPTSTAIQYLNGTTGATVYTMFVATDALGVVLNPQTNKVFVADKQTAVNGIVILQN
jgi:YVTN family beta-propeller protein